MSNVSKIEDAKFAVADLLSKDASLSPDEVNVIQSAMVDLGLSNAADLDGTIGANTSSDIGTFLNMPENLHVVPRISEQIKEILVKFLGQDELDTLNDKAMNAGHDPANIEGDTARSLLGQPYPLSPQELERLQEKIGAPVDGVMGGQTAFAVAGYLVANGNITLQNPGIIDFMVRQGPHYQPALKAATENSAAYKELVRGLIGNSTGKVVSATNYRLGHMLQEGGNTLSAPTGVVGPKLAMDIEKWSSAQGEPVELRNGFAGAAPITQELVVPIQGPNVATPDPLGQ